MVSQRNMDQRFIYVRSRLKAAMLSFAASQRNAGRLPDYAYQRFRFEDEPPLPARSDIELYVTYRQPEDVDLEVLYRDLEESRS